VIVDPKRRDFSRHPHHQPSRSELAAATGIACHGDEEVARAAEALIRQTGAALSRCS
jgi:hypothetical protein